MEKGANKLMDVLMRTRRFDFFWLSELCTVRGHFRRRGLAGYIREFAFFSSCHSVNFPLKAFLSKHDLDDGMTVLEAKRRSGVVEGYDMTWRFITVRVLSGTTISMLSFRS